MLITFLHSFLLTFQLRCISFLLYQNDLFIADYSESDLVFDETEFSSAVFQRPFQYLRRLDEDEELTDVNPEEPEGDKQKCLVVLLR